MGPGRWVALPRRGTWGLPALGGFLFGFDTAAINGAIAAVRDTFHASEWVLGLAVSAALVGSANRIRAVALLLAAAAQWVANFVVSATFPALQHAGLGVAYGLSTAAAVLSLLFTARYIRETKGKELEHIEHES